MAAYGLTPQGWLSKPLDVIDDEVDAGLQKILGASAGTDADGKIPLQSMAGQLKVLIVDGYGAQWDLFQALASSVDPEQANDKAQDVVCSITGTIREADEFSTVVAACTGTPNTPLQVGRAVTVLGTASRFVSQAASSVSDPNYPSSTIGTVTPWAQSTIYAIGVRRTANGKVYQCTVAGTSSNAGTGPAGTTLGLDIIDGSVTWRFLGVGTGAVDVPFIASVAGAVGANPNTLTQIATPISGWSSVTNLAGAVVGQLQESNSALRIRRDAELAAAGNGTPDAIRARVLAVNQASTDPNHQPPTAVKVLFNDKDFTDANGLPPHSVEVIVTGGTSADIAQAVWNCVDAGTATYGNQSSSAVDAAGNTQTVRWTRPVAVPIYIVATVYYDATKWPAVGAPALVVQAALSALLTFGSTYPVGQSARALPLGAAIVDEPSALDTNGNFIVPAPAGSPPAPGILDVTPIYIGVNPSPGTSTPIAIGVRQYAQFISSNITLTAVAEAP